jgi:iron-sulfur cluster assembly protein
MLTITDSATRKFAEILSQQSEAGSGVYALRLSAAPGCCSGAQYGMSLAEKTEEGDWEGEFGGLKVLVDPESAPFLEGVSIDYVETPDGAGFTINNPKATEHGSGSCGSGCSSCG